MTAETFQTFQGEQSLADIEEPTDCTGLDALSMKAINQKFEYGDDDWFAQHHRKPVT